MAESIGRPRDDLPVAGELATEHGGRPKRARRSTEHHVERDESPVLRCASVSRPTDAEKRAAQVVIDTMHVVEVKPPILAKNVTADVSVVACALALHFGQRSRNHVADEPGPDRDSELIGPAC